MNFQFYIFGESNNKFLQTKFDQNFEIFKEVANRNPDDSSLNIYRNELLVYYIFIKKLINIDEYFGIGLLFNGQYCIKNKELYAFFEKTIHEQIVPHGKILKSDLTNNVSFSTNDFQRNKVEIDNLDRFIHNEIDRNFANDFQKLDATFDQSKNKQQPVYFQDSEEYIVSTLKKYNFVTLIQSPAAPLNPKTQKKSWFYLNPLIVTIPFIIFFIWISNWHYISIIFAIVTPLFGFLIYSLPSSKRKKLARYTQRLIRKSKEDPFSVIGIFLAILSIIISSCWGIISLYENWKVPLSNLYSDIYAVKFNHMFSKVDTVPTNFVFIEDVSRSVNISNSKKFKTGLLEHIINSSGWIYHNRNYKIGDKYSDLLQAKLKVLLFSLAKPGEKGTYSIIRFSKYAEYLKGHENLSINEANLRNSFNAVDSLKFDGDSTNFVNLLDFLKNRYCQEQSNSYQPTEYTFIFLSDYFHDIISENDEEHITEDLKSIKNSSTYSNFYFFKTNPPLPEPRNAISIIKLIDSSNKASIDKNRLHYKIINIDSSDFITSVINSRNPLVFHYSSYFFSDSLCTLIDFGINEKIEPNTLKISVQYIGEPDNRQDFFFKNDLNQFVKLNSDELKPLPNLLKDKNTLELMMKGHITKQYPFAEIIFEDTKRHVEYHSEIVFLERLPRVLRWIIPVYLFIFCLYLFMISYPESKLINPAK